jgi:triosephosphate isomerase
MRQALVAGNWKLNGSKTSVTALVEGILSGIGSVKNADVAVCPPYVYLQQASEMLQGSPVALGAQNASQHESGAYTGEVAPSMLKEFACKYAIIGHSERRALYGETDDEVTQKFIAVNNAGLIPILCVGELLQERESGKTQEVVGRQIDAVVNVAGIQSFKDAVIAYEPVWAIGTGVTASPEQAQEVHDFIRRRLAAHDESIAAGIQILYGGSVKPNNAAELFAQADIDGGLIGGASLEAEGFLDICRAAT